MSKERMAISFHVELTASQDSDKVGLGTTSPSLDIRKHTRRANWHSSAVYKNAIAEYGYL